MRGRRPTPELLRIAKGLRPLPAKLTTCTTLTDAPPPPDGLDADAARHWRQLTGELCRRGVLTVADLNALERLCVARSMWQRAAEAIGRDGLTSPGRSKELRRHPGFVILSTLGQTILQLETQFGLTPGSRRRIGTIGARQDDQLDRFLKGKGA